MLNGRAIIYVSKELFQSVVSHVWDVSSQQRLFGAVEATLARWWSQRRSAEKIHKSFVSDAQMGSSHLVRHWVVFFVSFCACDAVKRWEKNVNRTAALFDLTLHNLKNRNREILFFKRFEWRKHDVQSDSLSGGRGERGASSSGDLQGLLASRREQNGEIAAAFSHFGVMDFFLPFSKILKKGKKKCQTWFLFRWNFCLLLLSCFWAFHKLQSSCTAI